MASFTQIPRLGNSSRHPQSSRGRGGGRRYGQAQGNLSGEDSSANGQSKDWIVQQTDQDAINARISTAELGYIDDPYARIFAPKVDMRYQLLPGMNRGTYVRTMAIDLLVDAFLALSPHSSSDKLNTHPQSNRQIISLGAGSDTRYFRILASRAKNPSTPFCPLIYHELDFPENTTKKISSIRSSPDLSSLLHLSNGPPPEAYMPEDTAALYTQAYNIHPLDLRDLPNLPILPNLSRTAPTLLLSECCLIYLPDTSANAILLHLANTLFAPPVPLALALYEPIRPDDSFGRKMVSNLAERGIELQTLHKYASPDLQLERLRELGFAGGCGAADVNFLWERWVEQEEKERVGRLEWLDEIEEWRLMARHYCVTWGWRDGEGADIFWRWRTIERPGEGGDHIA
ncbi:MAG: carboxy methyl transferase for protein phosphatase 2A [Trizodia sp. TS-e1964]|nr:MAG: carboxy methyl transferase for protein phosphatase 2A [Trizodia sp. TS-e1964]